MDNKIAQLASSISDALSHMKAYEMEETCSKYDLGDGSSYSSPASKQKFLYGLIKERDNDFIQKLAIRLINENDSDKVAYHYNEYVSGKYFKVSVVTRKKLVTELLKFPKLNGLITTSKFINDCGLDYSIKPDFNSFVEYALGSTSQKKEPCINEILPELNLSGVTDKKFFKFLELCVHPYVRSNEEATQLIITINRFIEKDGYTLRITDSISDENVYTVCSNGGVDSKVKNLIFASNGYKPEIVLTDSLSNTIKIVKYEESTLVYDRTIKSTGLLYVDLVDWWANQNGVKRSKEIAISLKERLSSSLASEPEKILFNTYYNSLPKIYGIELPALIPQIYLHYDPYSISKFGIKYLLRQRMDFLLLLKNNSRIVIEVDGKQHYANGDKASPQLYSEMVSQDRDLKLLGYEVYRFGGFELTNANTEMIKIFFTKLFDKHKVISSTS